MVIIKLLSSKRLALALIAIISIYTLWGASQGLGSKSFNMAFFKQPLFILLLVLLLINTFACTITQAKVRLRLYRNLQKAEKPLRWSDTVPIDGAAKDWLRTKKYHPIGRVVWAKRRYSLAFILLFHLSFILIGIGFLWSSLVRVEALISLTDGEELLLTKEAYFYYRAPAPEKTATQAWRIKAKRVDVIFPESGWPEDIQADIEIFDSGKKALDSRVKVVPPLGYRGHQLNIRDFSFAPYVTLYKENQKILEGYVALAVTMQGNQMKCRDEVILADGNRVTIEFFPRGIDREWGKPDRFMYPADPYLEVAIEPSNKVTALKLGETRQIGQYRIVFDDYRYVVFIKLIRDPGMTLIFIAFWLGLLSLAGHYMLPATFAIPGQVEGKDVIYYYRVGAGARLPKEADKDGL